MSDCEKKPEYEMPAWLVWSLGAVAAIAGIALVLSLCFVGAPWIHLAWLEYLVWPLMVALGFVAWRLRRQREPDRTRVPPRYGHVMGWVLLGVVTFYLFSGATDDPWFYFVKWVPYGGVGQSYKLMKSGIVRFCVLSAIFMPVLIFGRSRVSMFAIVFGMLAWSQMAGFNQFWHVTQGQALYGESHPCFLYNLWTFASAFPRLVYYDPIWNAGSEAFTLVSTGIIPVGTLALPVLKFFPVDMVSTPIIAAILILVVPFIAGLSAKVAGGCWTAIGCASILALGISQYYFLEVLGNGAVGLCFALSFVMLVCACLYRVVWLDGLENRTGLLLVVSAAMFVAWPPAALMGIVFIPALLAGITQWSARKLAFLVLCGAAVVLLCMPFVAGGFGHVDAPCIARAGRADSAGSGAGPLLCGWAGLCGQFRQGSPGLVFFGLLGVWFLPQKGMRAFYGVVIAGLCLLAGWGDLWNPSLHFSMAVLPLFFVAIVPAALWIGSWLESASPGMIVARAAILTVLLLCGLGPARIYGNKGPVHHVTMSHETRQFMEWVRKNSPENGRILLLSGDVADPIRRRMEFMPAMTRREMMDLSNCRDWTNMFAGVESGASPLLGADKTLLSFATLYNVSRVIVFDDRWCSFLEQFPEQFEKLKTFDGEPEKTVFGVRREPNQFLKGTGTVKAEINELVLHVDNPLEEAVIRYNWENGLHADPPVQLRPCDVSKDVRFIAINPHGKSTFSIHFRKTL